MYHRAIVIDIDINTVYILNILLCILNTYNTIYILFSSLQNPR